MRKTVLALLLLAAPAVAQDFRPSVAVTRAGAEVTIDMCASEGRNLRFGWDYDADGGDDQRGPCRRTITQTGPIRVTVWEAVGGEHGRHEETVWPEAAAGPEDGLVPVVWHNTDFALALPGIPAEFIFRTCGSSNAGRYADDPLSGITSSFDLDGDGVDDLVGSDCNAKAELVATGTRTVRVTVRTADASWVEYITVSAVLVP